MDDNKRKEIQDALISRGALLPCARCGRQAFTVLGAYSTLDQQTDFAQIILGGPTIPCAAVGCTNCGHVSLHALGALGLFKGVAVGEPPLKPPERSAQ